MLCNPQPHNSEMSKFIWLIWMYFVYWLIVCIPASLPFMENPCLRHSSGIVSCQVPILSHFPGSVALWSRCSPIVSLVPANWSLSPLGLQPLPWDPANLSSALLPPQPRQFWLISQTKKGPYCRCRLPMICMPGRRGQRRAEGGRDTELFVLRCLMSPFHGPSRWGSSSGTAAAVVFRQGGWMLGWLLGQSSPLVWRRACEAAEWWEAKATGVQSAGTVQRRMQQWGCALPSSWIPAAPYGASAGLISSHPPSRLPLMDTLHHCRQRLC